MTSYKTPSRNCPGCCPQNCNGGFSPSAPIKLSNGQVPINLSRGLKTANIEQGPRRFSGRDWRQRQFLGHLHVPELGTLKQNSRQTWGGGPGDAVKSEMALEFGSVSEIVESSMALLKNQWIVSCAEVGAAVKYLRHLWLTTNGNYSQKALVVNRMICFYLILIGIYIAESGFWVNQQLLQGLYSVVLKPKRNMDMLMGVGAVGVFIFLIYLIGGPPRTPGICSTPD